MLAAFLAYIKRESLFLPHQRILLAVSGGMDSMVMAELFRQAGFHYGIAHCHFGLRDQESDLDEDLVRNFALRLQVPFFSRHFQTSLLASQNGQSIQMAARELRYTWFNELLREEGFDYVATAHHLDDQAETLCINLIRGAGIGGVQGIRPRQGNIIHPLLFATRREIEQFQSDHNIPFRADSSNLSLKYIRNKIRHQILPLISEINPDYLNGMSQTVERLRDAGSVVADAVAEKTTGLIHHRGESVWLSIPGLLKLSPLPFYLSELLFPYGFNYPTIKRIASSIHKMTGKQFLSSSHCLLKDRDYLIIQPIQKMQSSPGEGFYIDKGIEDVQVPVSLHMEELMLTGTFNPVHDPAVAELDLALIRYPLLLRKWKKGDYFHPFGMQGKKKLSDFFIDQKISVFEKQNTWVLESDGQIVWVLGHRIDHRFRVTGNTHRILRIEWLR